MQRLLPLVLRSWLLLFSKWLLLSFWPFANNILVRFYHPLSLPLFLPLLQLCRRQCAGDRKVLRPCLWPQGRFWPRLPEADGGDQAQASTGDTTQFASAWPLRPAARRLPGHMSRRQLLALLGWAADLRLTAYPHHPQGTDGQGQPQAGSTIGVEHLGMMPAPLPPFVVLEAPFNPSAQAIPRAVDLMGRQISDHDPRLFIARLSTDEQGAIQPGLPVGKTGHALHPLLSHCGQPVADPFPAVAALHTGFGSQDR